MKCSRPCTALTATDLSPDDESGYPAPFREHCTPVERRALGDVAGLGQYGVNLLTLQPGQWSAQRHWHEAEDELLYVLSGEVTLITEAGEQTMRAGDFAGFPAGHADGHHVVNRSDAPAKMLETGARRRGEVCHYPDIDLLFRGGEDGQAVFTHKDGRPW